MNNDNLDYLYGNNENMETLEETTTTSEEEIEEETTTTSEEEIEEETTTTSEEEMEEETTTTSEEEMEEETTVLYDNNYIELIEQQNNMLLNCYDMLTYIFIVLMFILFRTYILHIFESIKSMGKD